MFVNATIQINPSLSLFKSAHCTYTDKKREAVIKASVRMNYMDILIV